MPCKAEVKWGNGNKQNGGVRQQLQHRKHWPFVVNTEAREAGDGVSFHQIIKTDYTFSFVVRQHILCTKHTGIISIYNEYLNNTITKWSNDTPQQQHTWTKNGFIQYNNTHKQKRTENGFI